MNTAIRASEVRVIGPDGNQLGIMPLQEALAYAQSQDLDLVEVAPNSQPPVCRVMDYGKFKYQQSKKAQASRKKQVTIQIKEVKIRPRTEEHDYQFKIRHTKKFLASGQKVKISIIFRGREISHSEQGRAMLQRIVDELKELAHLEVETKLEGRNMFLVLAPKG